MIYTLYGVEVEVIKYNSKTENVTVKEINGNWVAARHISHLKADGGLNEIEESIKKLDKE